MMADQETTVGDLRGAVKKFVSARNWEVFHNPKNLVLLSVDCLSIFAIQLLKTILEGALRFSCSFVILNEGLKIIVEYQ